MMDVTHFIPHQALAKKIALWEMYKEERTRHPVRKVFIVDLTTAHKFHSKDAKTAKANRTVVRYLRQPSKET